MFAYPGVSWNARYVDDPLVDESEPCVAVEDVDTVFEVFDDFFVAVELSLLLLVLGDIGAQTNEPLGLPVWTVLDVRFGAQPADSSIARVCPELVFDSLREVAERVHLLNLFDSLSVVRVNRSVEERLCRWNSTRFDAVEPVERTVACLQLRFEVNFVNVRVRRLERECDSLLGCFEVGPAFFKLLLGPVTIDAVRDSVG